MFSEARKLHLIEDVLQLKSETTLLALENMLSKAKQDKEIKKSAHDFVGLWSKKDATLIEKAIVEGCEQIHASDWK